MILVVPYVLYYYNRSLQYSRCGIPTIDHHSIASTMLATSNIRGSDHVDIPSP
jgi:hypothetical protein